MTPKRISDELWERIKPLLPKKKSPTRKGGRPRKDDRLVLDVILFVLETGIAWRFVRVHQFGCSRMTAWRRIKEWQAAGIWEKLHVVLLEDLQRRGRIRWSHGAVDSSSIRALEGGKKTGKNPTDRSRLGTKHHVLVDGKGVPLALRITGANRHDVTQIIPLIEDVPAVRGKRGRPRKRVKRLYADRAYDSEQIRKTLRSMRIAPYLAKRRTPHGSGLGKKRWVVERTISWLHSFRRLRIRWERRDDIHLAFMTLAACVICLRFLSR